MLSYYTAPSLTSKGMLCLAAEVESDQAYSHCVSVFHGLSFSCLTRGSTNPWTRYVIPGWRYGFLHSAQVNSFRRLKMKRLPVFADQFPLQGLALASRSTLERLHRYACKPFGLQRSQYGSWTSGESAKLVLYTSRPCGDPVVGRIVECNWWANRLERYFRFGFAISRSA